MNVEIILSDFQKKGYSTLSFPLSQEILQETTLSFRDFVSHTSEQDKISTDYRFDDASRVSIGYRDKSSEEGFDSKCYFHYNPDIITKNFLQDNSSYKNFITHIDRVFGEADKILASFISGLSEKGYIDAHKFLEDGKCKKANLRILNYKPLETCKTLAVAHVDRAVFTLAVFETHSGLRFGDEEIFYTEHEIKIFPSERWNEFVTVKLPGTEHEVIKKEGNTERSSIVVFVSPL